MVNTRWLLAQAETLQALAHRELQRAELARAVHRLYTSRAARHLQKAEALITAAQREHKGAPRVN
jgi:hypothetical protein